MDDYPNTKNLRAADLTTATYTESLAASLLLYAKEDKSFAKELRNMARSMRGDAQSIEPVKLDARAYILAPQSAEQALQRARWLYRAINSGIVPGTDKAAELLRAWREKRPFEEPKHLVVGIVIVAIPGVTMGKFKKRNVMNVIMRPDLTKESNVRVSEKAIKATHGVIQQALQAAGGRAEKLEPELREWINGEKETILHITKYEQWPNIKKDLKELNIPHSTASDEKGEAVIAVTPAANTEAQQIYWGLTPLN